MKSILISLCLLTAFCQFDIDLGDLGDMGDLGEILIPGGNLDDGPDIAVGGDDSGGFAMGNPFQMIKKLGKLDPYPPVMCELCGEIFCPKCRPQLTSVCPACNQQTQYKSLWDVFGDMGGNMGVYAGEDGVGFIMDIRPRDLPKHCHLCGEEFQAPAEIPKDEPPVDPDKEEAMEEFDKDCQENLGEDFCTPERKEKLQEIQTTQVIFALDSSGSMGANKRWDTLLKAYSLILKGLRVGDGNLVSLVNLESKAHLSYSNLTPTDALERKVNFYRGGTNFVAAMSQINIILKKIDPSMKIVVIFITDGDASYPSSEINSMNELKSNFADFKFFSVGIDVDQSPLLMRMAEETEGKYVEAEAAEMPKTLLLTLLDE